MSHRKRMPSPRAAAAASCLTIGLLLTVGAPDVRADVILQYFESRWETIERRMPDVFMAGYDALWLPPPARADTGDSSVGFDVFDRFDLGREGRPTLYGTESSFDALIGMAHRAGVLVYVDTVFNHNGYSNGYSDDSATGACQLIWATRGGGYPGFVMSGRDLGLDFNLEFRNICPSEMFPAPGCDSDPFNCPIAGLLDINHDRTDLMWIRHPVDAGNPSNIPYQSPRPENRRLYPDLDSPSPYGDGVAPFNLANSLAGDPYEENVNGMLQRYTQWMLEVRGVDGFRLDAVKHMPSAWFADNLDFIAHDRARDFWGRQATPFSFGEHPDGSWDAIWPYHRKDGYGNRTVLDFPLYYRMKENIGNPSGRLDQILGASIDGRDGDGQDGTAGVQFVQSHDNGLGDPPDIPNLAYAHLLTRKGYPIVYYNAREFGDDRAFPNNNTRSDALGLGGETITRLLRIHQSFVSSRGGNYFRSLWQDADVVAYEMNHALVVGMSDWKGSGPAETGYIEVTIDNFGFRGVTLAEVTGNAEDPQVDPNGQIPDTLVIPASGAVQLRIPTMRNANDIEHNRPYVMYSLEPPRGELSIPNASAALPPDGPQAPPTSRRLTPIDVVTGDFAQVRLQISGGSLEDNALLRWNHGLDVDGVEGIALGMDDPLLSGFENFTTQRDPRATGGSGLYRLDVDLRDDVVPEGVNYLSAVAFIQREASLPPILNTFRKVIYVDRRPPDVTVVSPATQSGIDDIVDAAEFEFIVENPDGTANSLHYFWNLPQSADPLQLVNESNRATRTDRARWRFTLSNLNPGQDQRLTLVLYEETGTSRLQDFMIGVGSSSVVDGEVWKLY